MRRGGLWCGRRVGFGAEMETMSLMIKSQGGPHRTTAPPLPLCITVQTRVTECYQRHAHSSAALRSCTNRPGGLDGGWWCGIGRRAEWVSGWEGMEERLRRLGADWAGRLQSFSSPHSSQLPPLCCHRSWYPYSAKPWPAPHTRDTGPCAAPTGHAPPQRHARCAPATSPVLFVPVSRCLANRNS